MTVAANVGDVQLLISSEEAGADCADQNTKGQLEETAQDTEITLRDKRTRDPHPPSPRYASDRSLHAISGVTSQHSDLVELLAALASIRTLFHT